MPIANPQLQKIVEQVSRYWNGISLREKGLIVGAAIVIVAMFAQDRYVAISAAFSEQSRQLQDVQEKAKALGDTLAQYNALRVRRDTIEAELKKVEIPEGVSTYLEALVKEHLGKDYVGLEIPDSPPALVGDRFQETKHSLKLTTTKFEKLVELLKAIGTGKKPLAIKRLDLRRSPRGDNIRVELDVSTIKEIEEKKKAKT